MIRVIETYTFRPAKKPVWPWIIFWIIVFGAIIGSADDKKHNNQNMPIEPSGSFSVLNSGQSV